MGITDRLRTLVDALPPDGSVTLTAASLRELLGGDGQQVHGGAAIDYTVEEFGAAINRAPSTIRGECKAGRIPGAYRLNGREWRIPRASLPRYLEQQRTAREAKRTRGNAPDADLGAWRHHTTTASKAGGGR